MAENVNVQEAQGATMQEKSVSELMEENVSLKSKLEEEQKKCEMYQGWWSESHETIEKMKQDLKLMARGCTIISELWNK